MNLSITPGPPDARADVSGFATPLVRHATEPYYHAIGDETGVFAAAAQSGLPVMLKGPTGCGKTRFVSAHGLAPRPAAGHRGLPRRPDRRRPGRPLPDHRRRARPCGATGRSRRRARRRICYLDEVVEARKDTTVVLHPLADDRRVLPIDRTGELLEAPPPSCWWCPTTPATRTCSRA
jgi:nitric oxide reductase NorQ protein